MQYFALFGTKVVDFNPNVTPYSDLEKLMGAKISSKLLALARKSKKAYSLVLFAHVQGQRFTKTIDFDNATGKLIATISKPIMSFSDYFILNRNCFNLQGRESLISKQEFRDAVDRIPLLANFIRAETLYRDSGLTSTCEEKTAVDEKVVCSLSAGKYHFTFEFSNARSTRVEEGSAKECGFDPLNNSYSFNMNHLNEEDTMLDVRVRIASALKTFSGQTQQIASEIQKLAVDLLAKRDIQILQREKIQFKWISVNSDLSRICDF
jgi:hypothetical protein